MNNDRHNITFDLGQIWGDALPVSKMGDITTSAGKRPTVATCEGTSPELLAGIDSAIASEKSFGQSKFLGELTTVRTLLDNIPEAVLGKNLSLYSQEQEHQSPDFVLAGKNYLAGIEATKSLSQKSQKMAGILKMDKPIELSKNPESLCVYDLSGLHTGDPRDTITKKEVEGRKTQPINWDSFSELISFAVKQLLLDIRKKTEKLLSKDYQRFQNNWLLINEDLSLGVRAEKTLDIVGDILKNSYWMFPARFDQIYIIHEDTLQAFGPGIKPHIYTD